MVEIKVNYNTKTEVGSIDIDIDIYVICMYIIYSCHVACYIYICYKYNKGPA